MTAKGVPIPDGRGRHSNHNQVPDTKIALAIEHIQSFPTMSSHYTRKQHPKLRYLEANVKRKKHMHTLYKKWLKEKYDGQHYSEPCDIL